MQAQIESLGRDLRVALRGLLRRPTFTFAVVLTLALGIGANTAIFTVLNSVLLKPLSYPRSDELVSLRFVAPGLGSQDVQMGPSLYFTFREHSRAFESVGLYVDGGQSITGQGEPDRRARYSSRQASCRRSELSRYSGARSRKARTSRTPKARSPWSSRTRTGGANSAATKP